MIKQQVNADFDILKKRVLKQLQATQPGSKEQRVLIARIGNQVVNQTKINVRKKNIWKTGRLINSINYQIGKEGDNLSVLFGSFGVPYAAIHEFGSNELVNVRQHARKITQAFGRILDGPKIVQVRTHARRMNIKARPYLQPAFEKSRPKIIQLLREMIVSAT